MIFPKSPPTTSTRMDHPLERLNSGIISSIFIHVIFEQQTQKSLNPKSTCRQAKPKAVCKHTAAVSVEVPPPFQARICQKSNIGYPNKMFLAVSSNRCN
ncbi:hypothetical protein M0804_008017 [Polistes exclamans]|nr:hypothetical protein M0804_008017 [Polistes exclamans]